MSYAGLFEYADFSMASTNFKIIYKNGYINGSIFEDGITAMLNSDLLAESWGRPIQDPWCGDSDNPHCTGNSEMIQFEEGFEWKRTQDHAKWAVPIRDGVEFSCLGDMNRMVSQWKRGGGFYCIQSERLRSALRNLIVEQETCS
jgi:deoxyribonuclease II